MCYNEHMKVVSYNINGIRASVKLGLDKWIEDFGADVYCFQEVRCGEELARQVLFQEKKQLRLFENFDDKGILENYYTFFNCGKISGYAGTLVLTKLKPNEVFYDMGPFWTDDEGRTTTVVFGKVAIVNAYIPNGNSRLEFKMKYLHALNRYLSHLKKSYSVICVGDFNIAHNEIDLTNPKECKNKSVFLPIERQAFSGLLGLGFVDCFRFKNPELVKYSWRSYRSRWDNSYNSWKYRIDYVLASEDLKRNILGCDILELDYSDHLPVVAEFENL